jgi:hypothetical protein
VSELPDALASLLARHIRRMVELAERADKVIGEACQDFADKTETDLRDLTERNGR